MTLGKHYALTLNDLKMLAAMRWGTKVPFESAAQKILGILEGSIRFDAAWLFRLDPRSGRISDIYLHKFCHKAFSRYLDSFYDKAPIPTIRGIRQDGFVSIRGSDISEAMDRSEGAFFKEVLRPLGLKYYLITALINVESDQVGSMVLWRNKERHDFSSLDSYLLEKGSIHCAAVLEGLDDSSHGAQRPELQKLATRRSSPAVIAVGKKGRILFMNREAREILTHARSGKEQLVRTEAEKLIARFERIRQLAVEAPPCLPPGSEISSPSEIFTLWGTTYLCRGITLEGARKSQGTVLILIETVQENLDAGPVFNNKISEFTAREMAVARLISLGFTNKEIASKLGIGLHTVKDHVKNIMGKLGTNTRSGIVAKVMNR